MDPVCKCFISPDYDKPQILKDCIWIFLYAVESNADIASMFLRENIILERLYQKLYHDDIELRLGTLKVFSGISGAVKYDEEQTFLTVEFMSALKSMFSSTAFIEREHSVFCLSNLVCSNPTDIEKIINHSIFPEFLGRMRLEFKTSVLKELALTAASLVNKCDISQLMTLARSDIVGSILALADQANKHKVILQLCARTIGELVDNGECLRSEYGGVNPIISEVSSHESMYHKMANELEKLPNLDIKTKGILELVEECLLTHTNIYN